MADKNNFWKIHKDFFERTDVRIIEAMPNGKDYMYFYLKLLCESVDKGGKLCLSDGIPLSEEMLAVVTSTNIDIVKEALALFTKFHMIIRTKDGAYWLMQAQDEED